MFARRSTRLTWIEARPVPGTRRTRIRPGSSHARVITSLILMRLSRFNEAVTIFIAWPRANAGCKYGHERTSWKRGAYSMGLGGGTGKR